MNKSQTISLKHFLLLLAAIAYIIFCFVINIDKGVSFYQRTAKMHSHTKDSTLVLKTEEKIIFDNDFISVRNQIIVVDTLIYRIDSSEQGSYLLARVICDNDNIIILKLTFDDEEVNEYASYRFKKVRLRANINKIRRLPFEKELLTFDNELVWHHDSFDYILEGSVEEIISLQSFSG